MLFFHFFVKQMRFFKNLAKFMLFRIQNFHQLDFNITRKLYY